MADDLALFTVPVADQFDTFYKRYPRKKGRPNAQAAFNRALKRTDFETIMAGLEAHMPYWQQRISAHESNFIPYPATWLNRDGWEDEVDVSPPRTAAARAKLLVDQFRQIDQGDQRAIEP